MAALSRLRMLDLGPEFTTYFATGEVATAQGNRVPDMAPHGVFPAAGEDRWVAIAVRSDAEWYRLAAMMGGTAQDARFATLDGRKQAEDEVEALVAAWTIDQDAQAVENRLQADAIAAHVVAGSADISADPQLRHLKHFVRLPHDLGGDSVVEASRFRLLNTPVEPRRAAPTFGRDIDYVLGTLLAYPAEKIDALRTAEILRRRRTR